MNTAAASAQPEAPGVARVHEPAELRASTYRLLGFLLSGPPPQDLLDQLSTQVQPGDQGRAIERAWAQLRDAAREHPARQWEREYNVLFIGVGEGELMPYGSWYLAGRVMDKPLARLRGALKMLGMERHPDAGEPEDHAAAICEVMALLAEDAGMSIEGQREFFHAHVQGWLPKFFQDLDQAKSANAYRSVAAVGAAFIELDGQYLSMLA